MPDVKTILIVDDETEIVESLKDLLTESGYKVESAGNGVEGLERLAKISPHLIILDMNMPKMGGIAFFKQITSAIDGKLKYPVLAVTGRSNLESLMKEFEVDGFLSKPYQFEKLLEEIQKILAKRYGADDTGALPAEPPVPIAEIDLSPKKVLVIGENKGAIQKTAEAFEERKYEVVFVVSGATGVERAASGEWDLIIVQLELPDMTGDAVVLKLKMVAQTVDIPVILYSAGEFSVGPAHRIYDKLGIKVVSHSEDLTLLLTQADLFLLQKKAAA